MGSNPVQDFLHDGFSKKICPKKNFREFTMQILFGSVRTLRNDSLRTLVSPKIAICRLSIDGNYRTTFQPSVERYSAHTRSASRPIAGRLSFAKLFNLVDRWSIPCRYVGRHSIETLTVTLHSTVGAYRSSVAELCIIVLSVVSYLISNSYIYTYAIFTQF